MYNPLQLLKCALENILISFKTETVIIFKNSKENIRYEQLITFTSVLVMFVWKMGDNLKNISEYIQKRKMKIEYIISILYYQNQESKLNLLFSSCQRTKREKKTKNILHAFLFMIYGIIIKAFLNEMVFHTSKIAKRCNLRKKLFFSAIKIRSFS